MAKESLNVVVGGCPSLSAGVSGSSRRGEVATGAADSDVIKPRRINILPVRRSKAPSVVSVGVVHVSVITPPLRVA